MFLQRINRKRVLSISWRICSESSALALRQIRLAHYRIHSEWSDALARRVKEYVDSQKAEGKEIDYPESELEQHPQVSSHYSLTCPRHIVDDPYAAVKPSYLGKSYHRKLSVHPAQ